ncbi:MAG: TlpA family protein disulfide reductase [Rugosibacter sp.]|nr:MAG: TlpA family protein disulfide reductase [Rugosibacter sp.]
MQNRLVRFLLLAVIAIAAGSSGYLISRERHAPDPSRQPSGTSTQPVVNSLLRTSFASTEGQWQTLATWHGKVLVINFWATWCPPCREEMPMFSNLQTKYKDKGLQFVGISIDSVDKVREYQSIEKITYPLLMGSPDAMSLSEALGNMSQALPFTVLITRQGQLDSVKIGRFSEDELEARLNALLKQ